MKQLAQSLANTFGVRVGYPDKEGKRVVAAPETTMKIHIEVTDTFGHEANYSWVRRYEEEVPTTLSRYALARRVKKIVGWTGKRCVTADYGDMLELRPQGECVVCFVTFN